MHRLDINDTTAAASVSILMLLLYLRCSVSCFLGTLHLLIRNLRSDALRPRAIINTRVKAICLLMSRSVTSSSGDALAGLTILTTLSTSL